MLKQFLVTCFIFLIAACNQSETFSENSNSILITNINIVSMKTGQILENRAVLIQDEKIKTIFAASENPTLNGVETLNGTGKFLSPGLIDAHVHVSLRSDLERYVAHGVTSVREMWGLPRRLRWRDAIKDGAIPGPNLVVASTFFWLNGPKATMHVEPTDPETARALVQQAKEEGYDLIKVVDLEDMEILKALVDEANKQNMRVSGHYPDRSVPLAKMMDVGMSSFEHADEISSIAFKDDTSDENIVRVAKDFAEREIGITTILTPAQNYLEIDKRGKDYYTAEAKLEILLDLGAHYFTDANQTIDNVIAANGEYIQQWVEGIALSKRAAKIFVQEGVPLAIGTEGISPFFKVGGVGLHDEMAFLSEAGLSNFEVMKVATVNGAIILGYADHKGYVREGYDADLLILSANPLENLEALQYPEAVFVSGRYYSKQDIEALKRVY